MSPATNTTLRRCSSIQRSREAALSSAAASRRSNTVPWSDDRARWYATMPTTATVRTDSTRNETTSRTIRLRRPRRVRASGALTWSQPLLDGRQVEPARRGRVVLAEELDRELPQRTVLMQPLNDHANPVDERADVQLGALVDPPRRVLVEQRLADLPQRHRARDRVLAHLLGAEEGVDVAVGDVLEPRPLDRVAAHP